MLFRRQALADDKELGISPQLEDEATEKRNQENPAPLSALPVPKKLLKPKGSGLTRSSRLQLGKKGSENMGTGGVGAVRGRRGPFRPLNGLASRKDDKPLKV